MTTLEDIHSSAQEIFTHALEACAVERAFDRQLHFDGMKLVRHPSEVLKPIEVDLGRYKKFLVIAFGKAALSMTDALLSRLPEKINHRGVCSAPEVPFSRKWLLPGINTGPIRYFAGGHPLPNKDSFEAAEAALQLLKRAGKDTFVFFLISGGGSAMLELPLDRGIPLEDTIAFHETLVSSGATITEINTVRKYFSAVKGGRLAVAAPEAEKLSLLVADVPLKDLAAVASSPTLPDRSTQKDCEEILMRYRLLELFPATVRAHFESLPAINSPLDATAFEHTQFQTLLSNHDFVNAARDRARELGFKVFVDNGCDDWDYTDAARYLLRRFDELRAEHPRVCLLSSGEVTVQLGAEHGCGGRNQQFALTTAFDLARHEGELLAVLSAGSDGIDGNSAAAGAIADPTTVSRARSYGFEPEATLARFDSCPLFTALGDSIVTGPTGNNLRDLRILLSVRE